MIKTLTVLVAAGLISFILFVIMAAMADNGRSNAFDLPEMMAIQFDSMTIESQTQVKDRRREPPPKPEIEEPPPDIEQLEQMQDVQPLPLEVTALAVDSLLDLDTGISLGQRLVDGSGAGNIVPDYVLVDDLTAISRIPPQYPRQALMNGIEGFVEVELLINEEGRVRSVRILNAEPSGFFERPARAAAMRWRFRPQFKDGVAIAVRARTTMEFELDSEQ
ncbi:MAG: energy transducer TonB [Pseudomonadota bacterium]